MLSPIICNFTPYKKSNMPHCQTDIGYPVKFPAMPMTGHNSFNHPDANNKASSYIHSSEFPSAFRDDVFHRTFHRAHAVLVEIYR